MSKSVVLLVTLMVAILPPSIPTISVIILRRASSVRWLLTVSLGCSSIDILGRGLTTSNSYCLSDGSCTSRVVFVAETVNESLLMGVDVSDVYMLTREGTSLIAN